MNRSAVHGMVTLRPDQPRSGCAINAAVEVIGDRWSLLVLPDALTDDHRVDEPVELVLHHDPIDELGEDMFTVHVCTPATLIKLPDRGGPRIGRHYLFTESDGE